MGITWDAYDMDPCHGGCGGYDGKEKNLKITMGKLYPLSCVRASITKPRAFFKPRKDIKMLFGLEKTESMVRN